MLSVAVSRSRVCTAALAAVATGGLVLLPFTDSADAAPHPMKYSQLTKLQKRLISGFASSEIEQQQAQARGGNGFAAPRTGAARPLTKQYSPGGLSGSFYIPGRDGECGYRLGDNVNMDQDCQNVADPDLAGRGQAQNEVFISQDRFSQRTLLGSSNDYRRGDGGCFAYDSTNGGRDFGDVAVPFGFTRGGTAYGGAQRQYWTAGGDTSSAFDTRGNAYVSCQVFNRGVPASTNPDLSSALLVFRSTKNAGASYAFPGRVVAEQPDLAGTGTQPFLDKPLLAVDASTTSRFRDRVYVSWTTFAASGTGYIYLSYSPDYGETWSTPVVVSGASSLCTNTYGLPTPNGPCNENQYSQPFTAPDGTLYVTWSNFNNTVSGKDNRNQVLLAKSTDGGATFSAPIKVSDYYDLPDCATATGQDAGRSCVPDKRDNTSFFRATNYPVGSVDPSNPNRIAVTFGSYINRDSNESNQCIPNGVSSATGINTYTGTRTPGACNNDILVSVSTNGGASFTGTTTDPRHLTSVTSSGNQGTTDQWFQWADFTSDGRLAVSYYDRQYGSDELTGWSDVSLSGSDGLDRFRTRRVTSSSMPAPSQFSGLFWGDYAGLVAYSGKAHPSWSDTRTPELFTCPGSAKPGTPPALCVQPAANAVYANDQEAFTAELSVPRE